MSLFSVTLTQDDIEVTDVLPADFLIEDSVLVSDSIVVENLEALFISNARALSSTKVRVDFTTPATPGHGTTDPDSYLFSAVSAGAVNVTPTSVESPPGQANPRFVEIVVTEHTDGAIYAVDIVPGSIVARSGATSGSGPANYAGIGGAPVVALVLATSATEAKVAFSENILDNSPARDVANYTWDGGLSTVSVKAVSGNVVTLETSEQSEGVLYNLTVRGLLSAVISDRIAAADQAIDEPTLERAIEEDGVTLTEDGEILTEEGAQSTWQFLLPDLEANWLVGTGETTVSGDLDEWEDRVNAYAIDADRAFVNRPSPGSVGWAFDDTNSEGLDGAPVLAGKVDGSDAYTIILVASGTSAGVWYSFTDESVSDKYHALHRLSDTLLNYIRSDGTIQNSAFGVPSLSTDLHVIAVTFDGTTVRAYVDDVLETTIAMARNATLTRFSLGYLLRSSLGDFITGEIAECIVCLKELDSTEISFATTNLQADYGL